MVVRYPENEGFPLVRSTLTEAPGFGPNAYEPVRNEELPLKTLPCWTAYFKGHDGPEKGPLEWPREAAFAGREARRPPPR